MDTRVNKESSNPIERLMSEDLGNISVDSLTQVPASPSSPAECNTSAIGASTSPIVDQSLGPALVDSSSFDSQPADTTPTGDEPARAATPPAQDSIAQTTTSVLRPFAEDGDTSVGVSPALTAGTPASLPIDGPSLREAEEYADDLARELISDTNRLVRHEHSHQEHPSSEQPDRSNESQASEEQVTATELELRPSTEQTEDPSEEEQANLEPKPEQHDQASSSEEPVDEVDLPSEIDTPVERAESLAEEIRRHSEESEKLDVETDKKGLDSARADRATEKTERQDDMMEFRMAMNDVKDVEELIGSSQLLVSESAVQEAQLHEGSIAEQNLLEFSADESLVTSNPSAPEEQAPAGDDLLLGQNDGTQQGEPSNADLADFELPPYSGSSSGSEPKQHSPVRRKSSSTASQAPSSSFQVNASPPDLMAVKKLLVAGYSHVAGVLHWRNPIETGVIFAIGLAIITALTFFSIISVIAYTAICIVMSSSLIRAYKFVMKTLHQPSGTPVDHIWNRALTTNVTISPEKLHQLIDSSSENLNASLVYFKQVLLIEDRLDTLKFCIFLYPLTYIGSWFNGMTLITLAYLAAFSMPLLYEKNKTSIDGFVNLASSHVSSSLSLVTNKVSSLSSGGSSSATSREGASKKRD